jgi:hypothetical protein
MNRSHAKAALLGIAALMLGDVIWAFVLMSEGYPAALAWISHACPIASGFLAAYFSPDKKIGFGLLMAVAAAVLSVASNLIFRLLGLPTDLPGLQGTIVVFVAGLASGIVFCGIGAISGWWLSGNGRSTERAP